MAAADSSLSEEFECAICSDQLKQPKFIGPCNHTFCQDCIQQYWISLGWTKTVPCPECRQECLIPQNGVEDLKDNFKLSNIMETYRSQQQRTGNTPEVRCIHCPKPASSFCKECDLKLCQECRGRRDRKACDHDLYGLCPAHGNGLLFFCTPCKQAVCSGCRISGHDEGNHNIIPIRPIVDSLISKIKSSSTELEDAILTRVEEQEKQLSRMRDIVQEKSTSAEEQATVGAERAIAAKRKDIRDHKAKSQNIQEQINLLLKEKEKVDDGTKQLVTDVERLEKEKAKSIANIRVRFSKTSENISQRLRSLGRKWWQRYSRAGQ